MGSLFFASDKSSIHAVGMYHVVIVNESYQREPVSEASKNKQRGRKQGIGKHWICIEIDDTEVPRPGDLTCRVYGNNTSVRRIGYYYSDIIIKTV
jgi:hypothetical protein